MPLVVVALALVAVPVQGCGGGESEESDSAQITKLSRAFLIAAKDGKWDEVCDTLSRHAKAEVAQAGILMGKTDCDEVMKSVGDLDGEATYTKIDPDDVRVSHLKVTGDRAIASHRPPTARTPAASSSRRTTTGRSTVSTRLAGPAERRSTLHGDGVRTSSPTELTGQKSKTVLRLWDTINRLHAKRFGP